MSGLEVQIDDEGLVRLAYFFTHGEAVMCPKCSNEVVERDSSFSTRVVAHYTADRVFICGGCGIYIGPINAEEMES